MTRISNSFSLPVTSPVEVLLVEDDPGDVDLIKETLTSSKIRVNLQVVRDGVQAMAYLHRAGQYAQALQPDLILLDLNLPKKDGREVLAEIRNDNHFKTIPVVVLTTSDADEDILRSYGLGANCYVTKPMGLQQFAKVVQTIETFWFTIVKLPPR